MFFKALSKKQTLVVALLGTLVCGVGQAQNGYFLHCKALLLSGAPFTSYRLAPEVLAKHEQAFPLRAARSTFEEMKAIAPDHKLPLAEQATFDALVLRFDWQMKELNKALTEILKVERARAIQEGPKDDPLSRALFIAYEEFSHELFAFLRDLEVEAPIKSFFGKQTNKTIFIRALTMKNKTYSLPSPWFLRSNLLTPFDFTAGFAEMTFTMDTGGVAAHVDKTTGDVHVQKSYQGQVRVVNGGLANDFFQISPHSAKGRSSALNKATGSWEDSPDNKGIQSVASVYNPKEKTVVHAHTRASHGIGLAYNERTEKVEQKEAKNMGVVGYYDPNVQAVVWKHHPEGNIAVVWRDERGQFHAANSFFADGIEQPTSETYRMKGMF